MDEPGSGSSLPQAIGGYDVVRLLGRGGMGAVYEAVERRTGLRVAIKTVHQRLAADPEFVERFRREAHVCSVLRSPYSVRLLDFGAEAGRCYLAMEYVDGETLAERIARGPLSPDEALGIAADIARSLEEAAAHGIVHRDIKPENVLLSRDGQTKVTDFGIARSIHSAGAMTTVGAFVGTAAYAPPEAIRGESDARSDIYSLGITLYCMLAGEPPFQGRTDMETLLFQESAPLPMARLSGLPDAVQNVLRRCLEKNPLDRYQTAAECAGALDRARSAIRAGRSRATPASGGGAGVRPEQATRAPRPEDVGQATRAARPEEASPPDATRVARAGSGGPPVVPAAQAAADATRVGQARVSPPGVLPQQGVPPQQAWTAGGAAGGVPAGKASKGRPFSMAVMGVVVIVGAGVGVAVALLARGGGGGGTPAATATVGAVATATPAASAAVSATASAANPSPTNLPTVTPPVGSNSLLASGVEAVVVAPGCTLRLWRNPSESSPVTSALRFLGNGDHVIVATNTPPGSTVAITEGLVFWKFAYRGGSAFACAPVPTPAPVAGGTPTAVGTPTPTVANDVGWAKEVEVVSANRFIVRVADTVVVGSADTCDSIAAQAKLTRAAFLALNAGGEPDCGRLFPGEVLRIR